MAMNQFKLKTLKLFLSEMCLIREVTAVLLVRTAPNNFDIGVHCGIYEPVWLNFDIMIDTIKFYIICLFNLDLDSRSWG